VLFREDASGKRIHCVIVVNRNGGLQDDGAGVEIFVHEMHRASGEFHAVFEGLALGFETGECRQKRRMNVESAAVKFVDEIG